MYGNHFFLSTKSPDKDECEDRGVCGEGSCENTVGGFECSCNSGYEPGPQEKCVGE